MTSQGFTRDLWSMGFASHPSLYGGKDKRLFVRYGEDSPQHGSLLDSEWRTNDVSTACEHSLGKLGIPEAQTLALSLTGSCMLLLQACHGKLGLDRDQAGLWTPGRLAYGFV
ncbi:hypothetical protein CI102_1404 [Trichoderma harzianum]|uniref:Uncharacterized protein n=1 Tax=Trichoderma harzianum CBS 226.95 TaxID=983964 RepID=A0A2T4AHJ4_TRIHA|nr:hypothetical protein M431DRAFT_379029 [Trichoderma harzianum CBS 226.95]PKK53878.1 hypothetical protein CI102_1404 [Trichoderma harzianum]PTB56482.1 hypothetical protein M431DRAFT_379029 [Trichoderma harzianum CBS 226.95]